MPEDLSAEERSFLLQLARRAIEARILGEPLPSQDSPPSLRRPQGAFVSLHERKTGDLRGCVGYVEGCYPLAEAVARAAGAAALDDLRFDPVTLEELSTLVIDVSVLSALWRIAPDQIQVGTHGLVVRFGNRRGLLLPQVATQHEWDRETFLDQTCRKAGLPPGTWREPAAEVMAFTATVFGEEE